MKAHDQVNVFSKFLIREQCDSVVLLYAKKKKIASQLIIFIWLLIVAFILLFLHPVPLNNLSALKFPAPSAVLPFVL